MAQVAERSQRSVEEAQIRLDRDIEGVLVAATDLRRLWDRELKPLTRKHDISERGLTIVNLVDAGLNRPGVLSDYFNVQASTMTSEIEKLVQSGHLARKPVAHDRRVTQLELTKKGRSVRKEAVECLNQTFRPLLSHIPAQDVKVCIATLQTIISALSPETPQRN